MLLGGARGSTTCRLIDVTVANDFDSLLLASLHRFPLMVEEDHVLSSSGGPK